LPIDVRAVVEQLISLILSVLKGLPKHAAARGAATHVL
jgi:hypothetical protein